MKFQLNNPFKPPPAPPAFGSGKILPEESSPLVLVLFSTHDHNRFWYTANVIVRIFSRLIFHWLSPFLEVGFSRPLELTGMARSESCHSFDVSMTIATDLWELPQPQLTSAITDKTEWNFYSRCPPEKRPRFTNKETQNASSTIPQKSFSKGTAGDTENDKQKYELDKEMVCRSLPES